VASLYQALVRNWRLKLSALFLSVFLWALVQTEPADQEAVRVPIAAVGSTDTTIVFRREWVQLGQRAGLIVESFSPASVQLSFEPAQTRFLPLAARTVGEVPANLALASRIEVSPPLVRVRGPESRLEGLDSLPLVAFNLAAVSRSGAFAVAVDTAGLMGASVVPPFATVGIRVEDMVQRVLDRPFATVGIRVEDMVQRVLDSVVVQAIPSPGEAEVVTEPAAVQIRLRGPRTHVTSLDPSGLRAWVPPEALQGMVAGEERVLPVRIEGVPEFVTAEPSVERVRVRRATDLPGFDDREVDPARPAPEVANRAPAVGAR
jgi:hypothetical protein